MFSDNNKFIKYKELTEKVKDLQERIDYMEELIDEYRFMLYITQHRDEVIKEIEESIAEEERN